jgi:hypothetical protein
LNNWLDLIVILVDIKIVIALIVKFQQNIRVLVVFFLLLILGSLIGNHEKRDYGFEDETGNTIIISFETNLLDCIDLNLEKESDEREKTARYSISTITWNNLAANTSSFFCFNFTLPPLTHFVFTQIDLPPPSVC